MQNRTDRHTPDEWRRRTEKGERIMDEARQQTTDDLPSWEECEARVDQGDATALHRFIYTNEPGGYETCREFREALAAVLAEVREQEAARAR